MSKRQTYVTSSYFDQIAISEKNHVSNFTTEYDRQTRYFGKKLNLQLLK